MGLVIAIDPGTDSADLTKGGSGVAKFQDGVLISLETLRLPHLTELIRDFDAHYVIEDVEAIRTTYNRNRRTNHQAERQITQSVGMVKCTARHIRSFLEWYGREYTRIKPTTGNWGTINEKHGSLALKQNCGWTGRSNKDTRSAAFLGSVYFRSLKFSHTKNMK